MNAPIAPPTSNAVTAAPASTRSAPDRVRYVGMNTSRPTVAIEIMALAPASSRKPRRAERRAARIEPAGWRAWIAGRWAMRRYRSTDTTTPGTTAIQLRPSPTTDSTEAMSTGPSARPDSPPAMNTDVPRPQRVPDERVTSAAAAGWNTDELTPARTRSRAVASTPGAIPSRLTAMAVVVGARMIQYRVSARSARWPRSGWTAVARRNDAASSPATARLIPSLGISSGNRTPTNAG